MRVWRGRILALFWLLVAGAPGCDLPLAPLAASPVPSATPVDPGATPLPSALPTPVATPSAEPTATPSVVPTPTPTPTPVPTPTPTPTPTPPGALVVGTSPETRGAWTAHTAMARQRMGHLAMVLDNRLVVTGGHPTETLESYQPASDRWEEQDLSQAYADNGRQALIGQYFACGGVVGTNRIVLASGFDGEQEILPTRQCLLTDGFKFTLAFGANLPIPRFAAAGTPIGTKLYVAGGLQIVSANLDGVYHGAATSKSLEAYEPTANVWTTLPSMPVAVSGASAVSLNGQLCVLGGVLANGQPTAEVQVFRPDTNQWVSDPTSGAMPPMSRARHSAAAAVLGGKIYVLGGLTADKVPTTACEVYDPATRTWQAMPPMPFARYLHAAAALGGRVYVLGGNNPQGQPQRTVEAFTP